MVHVNNCTSELNAWAGLLGEAISLAGANVPRGELMEKLFKISEESAGNAADIAAYNYFRANPWQEQGRAYPPFSEGPEVHSPSQILCAQKFIQPSPRSGWALKYCRARE